MNRMGLASLVLLGALAACGHKDRAADRLDNAAEQSTPAAADVLHNQADAIRDQGGVNAPINQEGSAVQQAMQKAGNAQAAAMPNGATANRQ